MAFTHDDIDELFALDYKTTLYACVVIRAAAAVFAHSVLDHSWGFENPVDQTSAIMHIVKAAEISTARIEIEKDREKNSDIGGFEMDPNPPYCIRRGSYVVPQPAPESPAKDHLTTPHRCSEDACQDPLTGNYQPHYNEALPKDPRGVWEQLRKESEDCSNPFIGLDILGRVKKESETGSCQEPLAAPERIRQPEPPEFLSGYAGDIHFDLREAAYVPPATPIFFTTIFTKTPVDNIIPIPSAVCIIDPSLGSSPTEFKIEYWMEG